MFEHQDSETKRHGKTSGIRSWRRNGSEKTKKKTPLFRASETLKQSQKSTWMNEWMLLWNLWNSIRHWRATGWASNWSSSDWSRRDNLTKNGSLSELVFLLLKSDVPFYFHVHQYLNRNNFGIICTLNFLDFINFKINTLYFIWLLISINLDSSFLLLSFFFKRVEFLNIDFYKINDLSEKMGDF